MMLKSNCAVHKDSACPLPQPALLFSTTLELSLNAASKLAMIGALDQLLTWQPAWLPASFLLPRLSRLICGMRRTGSGGSRPLPG